MEIIGSIVLSIIQSILFYGKEIGISMLIFQIICNTILIYILYRRKKISNIRGMLLLIPIILLSNTFILFSNKIFYVLNIIVIFILDLIMYATIIHEKNYFKNEIKNTIDLLANTVINYNKGINYTKNKTKEYMKIIEDKKINRENIKRFFISLLIITVIVGVIILLLSSADSIFANLFSWIGILVKKINKKSIFSFIIRLLIILLMYIMFLSLILTMRKTKKIKRIQEERVEGKYITTIKLLLIILNIVYLVFCFIQIQSLFAKINISVKFNYAEYARTGFFQLMVVSLINFAIILISNKNNSKKSKIIKILNLLLVIFTIIIAISSMYRMYMYESEYGLTYLRIFVYIILITEIIEFIPVVIYIYNEKFDFLKWCFTIGIVSYCIINYIGIERIIINKNINMNNKKEIDYIYINSIITEDNYDILEKKMDNSELDKKEKLSILNSLQKLAINEKEYSWQEFNISKYKMKERNIDTNKISNEIEKIQDELIKQEQIERTKKVLSEEKGSYVYSESINENEAYFVKEVNTAMGTAEWKIERIEYDTNNNLEEMSKIVLPTSSKIKFFADGLGFIERPDGIYKSESDLLVTHDYGKTFNVIQFPEGKFTLSDSERKKMERLL